MTLICLRLLHIEYSEAINVYSQYMELFFGNSFTPMQSYLRIGDWIDFHRPSPIAPTAYNLLQHIINATNSTINIEFIL